jgi:hypothetical protein
MAKAEPTDKPISPQASSTEVEKPKTPTFREALHRISETGRVPFVTAHTPTVTRGKRRGRPPQLSKKHEAAARDELRRYLGEDRRKVPARDQANAYILDWLKAKHDVEVKASTVRDRVVTPIFHERE